MGHALNNTLQDVLVRYKRMDGYNVLWVPGTDHAGIATQWVVRRQVEAEGGDFWEMGREKFVERVWAWKEVAGGEISNQLRRLGVSCDWTRERFTLDTDLQRAVTEHFVKLYEDGLIYRGQRLINWDPKDQTALSDLEVEHDEGVAAELWSFAYPIKSSDGGGEIVVATTRPETMLGDTAVAVHPDDHRYTHLIGKTLTHPFNGREIPIVADSILVDPEFGTGAVKVTPAHDFNDFDVGKRHDLAMINILNLDGTINGEGGEFEGLSVLEARKAVKSRIEALGLFRDTQDHTMNLGRSQRSGAVVEPMLSTQWFVRMKPLATPALAAVEHGHTKFVPTQWENTYYAWLRDIRDWCISRQLWWGHRIPAWYCDDCQHINVARTAPEVCSACSGTALTQDPDVLDTWFSSALWPFSVFGWPEKTADLAKYYPTSVLVTGFDIIFFWVARMMFAGQHLMGHVPFKDVYIHALVRDKNGQKMSKTKGNVVDPLEVIERWGADAFRFTLVAFAAQGRDVLWDEKRVEGYHRFTTKMWQALRFSFMHIEGYDPSAPMELGPYEEWIAVRTGQAVGRVRKALDTYRFNEAANEIYQFVWGEFCDWYIELAKTTLYDGTASAARLNGTRHTLFETIATIMRLLHPIMPFLTEDVWSRLPNTAGLVVTAAYPKVSDFPSDGARLDEIELLQRVITEARRVRSDMELPRSVPMPFLCADAEQARTLEGHARTLLELAGVSEVRVLGPDNQPTGAAIIVLGGHEILIPLSAIGVEPVAEVARLDKSISKARKELGVLEKRLHNPRFMDRAPESVRVEVQSKHAAEARRIQLLEQSRIRAAEGIED
jgi:valyl-tRNA synthetase